MKLRVAVTAALLVCLAATALAEDLGPLNFLLTKEEAAAARSITGAAGTQDFVDLFWARRDPTPETARNEYREQLEARIAFADANFKGEPVRGAMTDRGKVLILYGKPVRSERTNPPPTTIERNSDLSQQERPAIIWTYEGEEAKALFGSSRVAIRFVENNRDVWTLERGRIDMTRAQERAVARAITQPALTKAPTFAAPAAAAAAPAQAAPAAPPAPATELTTEIFRTAVADPKPNAQAAWGEFVTSFGETFVPVGLYIPKSLGVSGTNATFFGVVRDANGKNVLAFEEPVTLTATRDDFYADKSLTLPAGKHRGVFGVAQGGKVIALATADMELTGAIDNAAPASSRMILSNNVYPLPVAQKPNDPFSFGGLKVVPKADLTFRTSDELWYFIELRNPGLAEPTTVPVDGTAAPQMPKIQVKMDVAGTDSTGKPVKMAAAPRETDAIELRGVPGHFGVGNALPPSTFRPGEYTLTVKVIDTIRKTSYTHSEKFRVVE